MFYSHLYTAEPTPDVTALKSHLSELSLPLLIIDDAERTWDVSADRSQPKISLISKHDTKRNMYHYADDPLLYFTDISISLPQIRTSLYPIIKLSCYKINWGKSLLVPLNIYFYILWFKYNQII